MLTTQLTWDRSASTGTARGAEAVPDTGVEIGTEEADVTVEGAAWSWM